MTDLLELEMVCASNDLAIGYLGPARHDRSGKVTAWACTIQPAMGTRRWSQGEFYVRGSGTSLGAALEDALAELSHFLIERVDPP